MLRFQPKPGVIVYCDYKGFIEPEMVKARPVVVLSKHKHNSKLITVVPISTTRPDVMRNYHIEMDPQFCLIHLNGEKCWVKCDMINVVSLDRLNLLKDRKSGLRHAPVISEDIFEKIKTAVKNAHNL